MHLEAQLKLTSKPVDDALNAAHSKQKETNRGMLKEVVSAIRYLSRQSIALRGM